MPDVTFDLVGPTISPECAERVLGHADRVPNMIIHGRVARDEISGYYRRASLLCSTSAYEGFPNTFLEAWSYGVPVVSTFDPGDLIARHGLGTVAEGVEGLVKAIRDLIGSPDRWRIASGNARRYYVENHTVEVVMPLFERVFVEALRCDVRPG